MKPGMQESHLYILTANPSSWNVTQSKFSTRLRWAMQCPRGFAGDNLCSPNQAAAFGTLGAELAPES